MGCRDLGPEALIQGVFVLFDQSYLTKFGLGLMCLEEGGVLLACLSTHGDGPQNCDGIALNISPLEMVKEGLFEGHPVLVNTLVPSVKDEFLLPVGLGRGHVISSSLDE
jgi:hypothetical protein